MVLTTFGTSPLSVLLNELPDGGQGKVLNKRFARRRGWPKSELVANIRFCAGSIEHFRERLTFWCFHQSEAQIEPRTCNGH
jgi:hypothetical protein